MCDYWRLHLRWYFRHRSFVWALSEIRTTFYSLLVVQSSSRKHISLHGRRICMNSKKGHLKDLRHTIWSSIGIDRAKRKLLTALTSITCAKWTDFSGASNAMLLDSCQRRFDLQKHQSSAWSDESIRSSLALCIHPDMSPKLLVILSSNWSF